MAKLRRLYSHLVITCVHTDISKSSLSELELIDSYNIS